MTELHVFTNGADYVIAESIEEAITMLPYPAEMVDDEPDGWHQEKNDNSFEVWLDDDGEVCAHHEGHLVGGRFRDWIESFGKGYFCTTEY